MRIQQQATENLKHNIVFRYYFLFLHGANSLSTHQIHQKVQNDGEICDEKNR